MSQPSAASRIARVGDIIRERAEDIYKEGGLYGELWEELMGEEVLGLVAPTGAVARAIVAQLQGLEDGLLKDIVVDSITDTDTGAKERAGKRGPIRVWLRLLREECLRRVPGSLGKEEEDFVADGDGHNIEAEGGV